MWHLHYCTWYDTVVCAVDLVYRVRCIVECDTTLWCDAVCGTTPVCGEHCTVWNNVVYDPMTLVWGTLHVVVCGIGVSRGTVTGMYVCVVRCTAVSSMTLS